MIMMQLGFVLYMATSVVVAVPLGDHVQPVVGILTQPPSIDGDAVNFSLMDASYVKYLEGGGALVVPILFNQTAEETETQFFGLSGMFFTGGPAKPTDFQRYFGTASLLFDLAKEHGMPLWGTCLGFQMISDLAAGGVDILGDFDSEDLSLPLSLTSDAATSRLLGSGSTPPDVLATLSGQGGVNVTTNWHKYGVGWPEPFSSSVAAHGMVALSTNADQNGIEFVSSMEHEALPIYATQWHPEANQYDRDHQTVDHGADAVRAMQWMAAFFVSECRVKGVGWGDLGPRQVVDYYPILPFPGYSSANALMYVFS